MGITLILAVFLLALPAAALAQAKVLKYAHFQPARPDQPKHAAALAFKEHVEKATNGSIKVEIYPAGQFGNDADTMSGLRLGTLDMAVAHDGAIAVIYKPVGVLGIPFLYENHEHAWRVYDSPWLKGFSDDLIKKTGVRLLSLRSVVESKGLGVARPTFGASSRQDFPGPALVCPDGGLSCRGWACPLARRCGSGDEARYLMPGSWDSIPGRDQGAGS